MQDVKRGLYPGQGAGLTVDEAQRMYGGAVKRKTISYSIALGNNQFNANLPGMAKVLLGIIVSGTDSNRFSMFLNNLNLFDNLPTADLARLNAQPDFIPVGLPVNGNDTIDVSFNQATQIGETDLTLIFI